VRLDVRFPSNNKNKTNEKRVKYVEKFRSRPLVLLEIFSHKVVTNVDWAKIFQGISAIVVTLGIKVDDCNHITAMVKHNYCGRLIL
jgi:hypothetical protein